MFCSVVPSPNCWNCSPLVWREPARWWSACCCFGRQAQHAHAAAQLVLQAEAGILPRRDLLGLGDAPADVLGALRCSPVLVCLLQQQCACRRITTHDEPWRHPLQHAEQTLLRDVGSEPLVGVLRSARDRAQLLIGLVEFLRRR